MNNFIIVLPIIVVISHYLNSKNQFTCWKRTNVEVESITDEAGRDGDGGGVNEKIGRT